MKTQLIYIMVLILISTLSGSGQTINDFIKRSTINWSDDMNVKSTTDISLENAKVESKKKITLTAASGKSVRLSNVIMNCSQLELTGQDIYMNDVKIDCDEIVFDGTVQQLEITHTVKINAKRIIFRQAAPAVTDFKIHNNGSAELSAIGSLQKNNRVIVFSQIENFKVTFQEN